MQALHNHGDRDYINCRQPIGGFVWHSEVKVLGRRGQPRGGHSWEREGAYSNRVNKSETRLPFLPGFYLTDTLFWTLEKKWLTPHAACHVNWHVEVKHQTATDSTLWWFMTPLPRVMQFCLRQISRNQGDRERSWGQKKEGACWGPDRENITNHFLFEWSSI